MSQRVASADFDNVLLPSVQRHHQQPATESVGRSVHFSVDESEPVTKPTGFAGNGGSSSGSDERDGLRGVDDAGRIDAGLDGAMHELSFVRKILPAALSVTSTAKAPVSKSPSAAGLAPAVTDNTAPSQQEQARRVPRAPGLGKHGRLKKGRRPHDPYGCEAAADAANRSWHRSEIAAVEAYAAGVDQPEPHSADVSVERVPAIASGPATLQFPLHPSPREPVGGTVRIIDPVPKAVRGVGSSLS